VGNEENCKDFRAFSCENCQAGLQTLLLSLIGTESPQSDPLSDEDLKSKAGQEAATAHQNFHFQKK